MSEPVPNQVPNRPSPAPIELVVVLLNGEVYEVGADTPGVHVTVANMDMPDPYDGTFVRILDPEDPTGQTEYGLATLEMFDAPYAPDLVDAVLDAELVDPDTVMDCEADDDDPYRPDPVPEHTAATPKVFELADLVCQSTPPAVR